MTVHLHLLTENSSATVEISVDIYCTHFALLYIANVSITYTTVKLTSKTLANHFTTTIIHNIIL